ncbi:MAG TPA: TonB-dependent receptor, partial [Flavisolibacter sp.]|nr:TonB-dependent receptor [Flavisolibacter sp.]
KKYFYAMRKFGLLCLLAMLLTVSSFAQDVFQVKGMVADTSGQPLQGVTIRLVQERDSALAMTDKSGLFQFSKIKPAPFTITATYTGLHPFSQSFTRTNTASVYQVDPIILVPASMQMDSIVITSIRPVIIKEDTIQYDASAYKVREGAPVEDVIKKLPGVTVDKDGNVEAQGKKVSRVRVNGKDFFGGDLQTATQNLPAEIIQNIQIIDDYGDQANLTGIKSGEPEKIININTQPNRNKGNFGNATAAIGNENRFAGNIFVNNFDAERQISILGAVNNTNANLFNFNGGGRGGGARGANFGSDGRGGGGGAGITLSQSVGLNFRDKWGEKLSVYGSYSFSARNTEISNTSFSRDLDSTRSTQRQSTSRSSNMNHRLTWNMEYAMDSLNFFKITPYVSHNSSENTSRGWSAIKTRRAYTLNNSNGNSNSSSPNAGGNFLYNHKFRKRGRNLSVNFSLDYSNSEADRFSNNNYYDVDSSLGFLRTRDTVQIQNIGTTSRNTRTSARASYAEPLNAAANTFLELSYEWNRSNTESIRNVFDLADSVSKTGSFNKNQSNEFNYQFITNRAGISIKSNREKYNYNIGVQAQPSSLRGRSVSTNATTSYNNINWVPSARFVYNFARNNSLTATANGSAREPGFMQLQPIADSTNLNNIVVGNPQLKNEFTNRFSLQYNRFDPKAGSSLFINVSYDKTYDRIVSNRDTLAGGTRRITSYLNTDGFYGYNGNASYTKPFSNRKFSATVRLAGDYDNNISFRNKQRSNGSNWNLRPGVNLRLDLENVIDLSLRGDYTAYHTTTRFPEGTTTFKSQTLNVGVNGKNYFGDLTIGYDFSKLVNYGFSSSVNANPTILNVYAEYRFMKGKMTTVRLQGFDLFDQNSGISRTVNEQTITDSRVNRLARYFLLSVNIRMAKFSGGNRMRGNGGGGGNRPFQRNN